MSKIVIKNDTTPSTPASGTTALYVDSTTKKLVSKDDAGTETAYGAGGGSGDVAGPASSTDSNVAMFDGTTGKLLKDSGLSLSGSNTGDQTSVTGNSGSTDALKSATTTVDVVSATAPTTGQVLTATGASAATWQTPSGGLTPPGSSTDNAIVLWDGTGADTVQDSLITIDSVGRINLDQTSAGDSLYIGEGAGAIDDLSANKNVGIGWTALTLNITGSNNVAMGYGSMRRVTGSSNTGVGYQTLYNATSSALNTAIGTSSLNNVTTGSGYNTGIGASSGNANTTGAYNTFLGGLAGGRVKAGSDNITIGYRSGYGVANNSFSDCIYIGNNSGTLSTTGSDNILIGHSLELPTATTSNYISIDDVIFANNSSGNVGIGTTDYGSGSGGVIGIVNATAPSGTPTGGGVLYVEAGALKYKGSSGTITTLGVA